MSDDPVVGGVGLLEVQAVAGTGRVGGYGAAVGWEGAVEEHGLDAVMIVEVLDVPEVRDRGRDRSVKSGSAVPGDQQMVGVGSGATCRHTL